MGYVNGIVTWPVAVYDIQRALGESFTDLAVLCRSTKISMWAKFKPVPFAKIDTTDALTTDDNNNPVWNLSALSSNQWWKGSDGNYGLSFTGAQVSVANNQNGLINALTTLATKIDGEKNGWAYLQPTGGQASPYRIIDFLQYRSAENPFSHVSVANVIASDTLEYSVDVGLRRTANDPINSRDYIVPEDISSETLYLGFAIYKYANSVYSPIAWVADGGLSWYGIGINASDGQDGIQAISDYEVITKLKSGGIYYALPIFCTMRLSQPDRTVYNVEQNPAGRSKNDTSGQAKLITVPYVDFVSFRATQRQTAQNIGLPEISNKQISVRGMFSTVVYLDSTYDGYVGGTPSNVTVAVVNEDWNGVPTANNQVFYRQFEGATAITVGANERKEVCTISGVTTDTTKSWRVLVSVNGEQETFNLIQPYVPFI